MDGQRRFIAGPRRSAGAGGTTEYPALRAALLQESTTPAERAEPRPAGHDPQAARCVLFTKDAELAQSIALVAVGAGVQLVQCRDAEQARAHQREVMLVGHDCAGEAAHLFPGARLVLTGTEEHQDVLWRAAASCPGARVAVLPQGTAWLGEYLGELGLNTGDARVTLLAGGCGGAGTSTVAALLAATHTLAGYRTLLIDADAHSTGLWPMLRPRDPEGIGWEDLQHSRGALAPGQLAEILPLAQGSAVLSWVRHPGSFAPDESLVVGVLAASRRIYEHIVIDAGRLPAVPPGMLALSDGRLLIMPARCAVNRSIRPVAGSDWSVVFTGTLASGMDTRALASAMGLSLGGYLPRLKSIERSAAEGRLMSVLARTSLRRRIAGLGTSEPAALGRAA